MVIKEEKILTISASDWAKINDKNLADYKAVGVHYQPFGLGDNLAEELGEDVPKGTEVVVDFTPFGSKSGWFENYRFGASGTALIPKKKE